VKIETLDQLLHWCSAIHSGLAERMGQGSQHMADGPVRWLMEYVATHEGQMAEQLEGLRKDASASTLRTWVYDWLQHPPPRPEELIDSADLKPAFEAVARQVFDAHNEIMTLVRFLGDRADTPGSRELLNSMLSLEEGHTRQIGQQLNRIRDM